MRYLTICLFLLGASSAGAMDVWRWVDKDGVVHFSDRPMPGAEKIQLNAAPKPGTATPNYTAPAPRAAADAAPFRYTRCAITTPAQDDVFDYTEAIAAGIDLLPDYRDGDRIQATLNGERVKEWSESATSYAFAGLPRGSYSLVVTVLSADGQVLCMADAVGFHVRQPSLLTPGRKLAPRS